MYYTVYNKMTVLLMSDQVHDSDSGIWGFSSISWKNAKLFLSAGLFSDYFQQHKRSFEDRIRASQILRSIHCIYITAK